MIEEKKPATPPETETKQAGEELSEKSLEGIAGGGNPFAPLDENGNPFDPLHGELPEGGYGNLL